MIEEFFKALKTGCAYETAAAGKPADAAWLALALLVPVAWQLLLLRQLGARTTPEAGPATAVL